MVQLTDMLYIKYPIIQGGMANIATGEFAAAVSNAGGLGLIATGGLSPEGVREHIQTARLLTDKPFGVNLMLMHPQAEEIANMLADEQIAVITTGAGNPERYVERWKQAGSKVLPVIPSVALAKRMERAGVDGIIAEGTEAGGHVGELTTMALTPQVVDAVTLPVVAAGGIGNGRQLVAAFALGAVGVQLGTCLLVSEECPIHENYKQALLDAKDTGTTVTGRVAGVPVRILKNKIAREYLKKEREGASREELEHYMLGALRRAVFDGDVETGSVMAGQISGQLTEIRSVKDILDGMMQQATQLLRDGNLFPFGCDQTK